MKIRIKDNSVRLRLSQTEVAKFGESGQFSSAIHFQQASLRYTLKRASCNAVQAKFAQNEITILVPGPVADNWCINDSEVGFSAEQNTSGQNVVSILVEKDFACLQPREHEDESDNYPNPKAL